MHLIVLHLFHIASLISYIDAVESCASTPAKPQDRRSDKSKLRIVSLNAEYLMYDKSTGCSSSWHGCPWRNAKEALNHMKNVGSELSSLDADIYCLNEVHSCSDLDELMIYLSPDYNPYLIPGRDSYTGQNSALISRIDPFRDLYRTDERETFPVFSSTCNYTGSSGTYGVSKHYVSEFRFGNMTVGIIGVHLLAFPTSKDRCAKREAQAVVVRQLVDDLLLAGKEVIVVGDFNDYDSSFEDIGRNKPISSVLDILKDGTSFEGDGSMQLMNLCEIVPIYLRFSAWYDANNNCVIDGTSELSLIDHFLVSKNLFKAISRVQIAHDYGSFGNEEECISDAKYVSDHWPIIVDFNVDLFHKFGAGVSFNLAH